MDLCFSSRGVGDNLPRRPQEINTLPYWSPRPQGICNSLNISKAPSELSLTSKNTPHQPSWGTTEPKPSAPPPRSGQQPGAWGWAGEGSSGCSGHARLGTGYAGAPSVGRARRWSSRECRQWSLPYTIHPHAAGRLPDRGPYWQPDWGCKLFSLKGAGISSMELYN